MTWNTQNLTDLTNLASEGLGAQAIAASDEFFAPKENLVRDAEPVFFADKYTEIGKWMDGWESRRKRTLGHDWCVVKLAMRGRVYGVDVDTQFFTGNFPECASLEGVEIDPSVAVQDWDGASWRPLVAKSRLSGGCHNFLTVSAPQVVTHLRLNSFPDGGIARLRAYGDVVPAQLRGNCDLAALLNGARVVDSSDRYFSHHDNLILPGHSKFMGGGWETRRRRGPGFDWIIVRLGACGVVTRIELDTDHYFGNYPEAAWVDGLLSKEPLDFADFRDRPDLKWTELVPRSLLKANFLHRFDVVPSDRSTNSRTPIAEPTRIATPTPTAKPVINYVRLSIIPDGGIARMRVFGDVQN